MEEPVRRVVCGLERSRCAEREEGRGEMKRKLKNREEDGEQRGRRRTATIKSRATLWGNKQAI